MIRQYHSWVMHMRRRSLVSSAAVIGVVAVVVAGCGSSGGTGGGTTASSGSGGSTGGSQSANVAYAKAQVTRASRTVTKWKLPGAPFHALKAAGKTVWFIPITMSDPAEVVAANSLRAALAPAHVKVQTCDGKGTPDGWTACVNLAVHRHGSAIVLESVDPKLVAASLQEAQKHHIAVIDSNNADPTDPLAPGENARVAFPYSESGRLVADWVIADSGGHANVFIVYTSDAANWHALVTRGYLAEFKARCPGCTVTVRNLPIAQWATNLQTLTQSAIAANPKIDYVIPAFDSMATYVVPGIRQAGAANRIKVATFNGNLDPMQKLQAGDVVYEDLGDGGPFLGYATADQVLRLLAGVKPVADEEIPYRMFTRANVKGLTLTQKAAESPVWYGPVPFASEFKKLWGVG